MRNWKKVGPRTAEHCIFNSKKPAVTTSKYLNAMIFPDMHLKTMSFMFAVLLGSVALVFAEDFEITIARKYAGADCTSGYLLVNGKVVCYALERAHVGNQPLISAIPAGVYKAHLRYDHTDQWRIELDDVPGRTNIQIHIGNVPADSEGCVLVGENVDAANLCKVTGSIAAYKKLKEAFYGSNDPMATPNKAITVKVEDSVK